MEREYGPEGQIIIRGFPKSRQKPYGVPPGPNRWERVREFLLFYWPGIFILLVIVASTGGAIVAWTSSPDASGALTEQELAALVTESESGAFGDTEVTGAIGATHDGGAFGDTDNTGAIGDAHNGGAIGGTPETGTIRSSVNAAVEPSADNRPTDVLSEPDVAGDANRSPAEEAPAGSLDATGSRADGAPASAIDDSAVAARRDDSTADQDDARQEPTAPETAALLSRAASSLSSQASEVPGELVITSTPAGAAVEIDGERRGMTPLHVRGVTPGRRALRITMDGYAQTSEVLDVESAQTVVRFYELNALQGTVVVQVRPWGSIYVNGELRARDLDVRHSIVLPVGSYRIAGVHPVLGRREVDVRVQPGQTEDVTIDLTTPDDR